MPGTGCISGNFAHEFISGALLWKAGCSNGFSFNLLAILLGPVSLTTTYVSDAQTQAHAESVQKMYKKNEPAEKVCNGDTKVY